MHLAQHTAVLDVRQVYSQNIRHKSVQSADAESIYHQAFSSVSLGLVLTLALPGLSGFLCFHCYTVAGAITHLLNECNHQTQPDLTAIRTFFTRWLIFTNPFKFTRRNVKMYFTRWHNHWNLYEGPHITLPLNLTITEIVQNCMWEIISVVKH